MKIIRIIFNASEIQALIVYRSFLPEISVYVFIFGTYIPIILMT